MTPEQVQVFAEALYRLAVVDGVHDGEVVVIKEFLKEVGAPAEQIGSLGKKPFEHDQLEWTLNTQHLRRVFIKTCWVLVKSDGKVSDKERHLIREYAEVVGELEHLAELEQAVDGQKL